MQLYVCVCVCIYIYIYMCVCVCVRARANWGLFYGTAGSVVLVFIRRKFADEVAGAAVAVAYWRTVRDQFPALDTSLTEPARPPALLVQIHIQGAAEWTPTFLKVTGKGVVGVGRRGRW
jgi:hypothetical protein